jgi:hypothetical protein
LKTPVNRYRATQPKKPAKNEKATIPSAPVRSNLCALGRPGLPVDEDINLKTSRFNINVNIETYRREAFAYIDSIGFQTDGV